MKAAIVVTSIHDCSELLGGYLENFAKYGREASIILIPDRKTPPQKFSQTHPIQIVSFDLQEHFLERVGFPVEEIPWNSDNRRNVGYLMALADGAEVIVSIDDDNYCPQDEDFIGEHSNPTTHPFSIGTSAGWYNNCELIGLPDILPRGFPYFARELKPIFVENGALPIRINAGMWVGDPDLDAITWLVRPCQGKKARDKYWSEEAVLNADTWCPINSQNTSVHRDLMPAYWFVRMDPPNDRFGDIFQGYFALKVAKHMGWTARFGSPFVTHRRNSHVYLKDVQKEIGSILLIEELLPKLIEHKLSGSTVVEAYLSLADFIDSEDLPVGDMACRMRLWAETCRRIG